MRIACAAVVVVVVVAAACSTSKPCADGASAGAVTLPLCVVKDVPLGGGATRFDYQDVDAVNGRLIIAHMGDNTVEIVSLADGKHVATIANVNTARGVLALPSIGKYFASAAGSDELVVIDATSLAETKRVATAAGPDGIAYDDDDHVLAVSAQHAGQLTFLAGDGDGARTDVAVGADTGNVAYDKPRHVFFVTVTSPDTLVEVNATTFEVVDRIALPGCSGAHGLRIHPDGKSALIACEENATLARVDLNGADHAVTTAATGAGPDVLAIDAGTSWLYVAAESGDVKVFDIALAGLHEIDSEHVGDNAHSVAVDAATHRVFFPLRSGTDGAPTLRIMRPGA